MNKDTNVALEKETCRITLKIELGFMDMEGNFVGYLKRICQKKILVKRTSLISSWE